MKHIATATLSVLLTLPGYAITCESLKAEVQAKFKAGGVQDFSIAVVAADAVIPGKVVGTCDLGKNKLIYAPGAGAVPSSLGAPALVAKKTSTQPTVITECKDGSTSTNGSCKK